jgi:c-di-GMP-binding flagellar brake protein YcgR
MSIFGFLFGNGKGRALRPRFATRLATSEPVRLRLPDGSEQPAILQDVSSGGAALRTHQPMHVGERLEVLMHFGMDQRYDLHARVVYARPGKQGFHARYGVRFLAMNDDDRFRLDTFVNERVAASQSGFRAFVQNQIQQ